MYLIQILVPLYDNEKQPFSREEIARVREELARRFGGVTVYYRSPAHGVWKEDEGSETHDDLVIFEVMTGDLDREEWQRYRAELERQFRQEEMVVRAITFEQL